MSCFYYLNQSFYVYLQMKAAKLKRFFLDNQFAAAFFLFLILWFLWEIQRILVILFLAYLLVSVFVPLSRFLQKKGFPRLLAVLIPYFLVFGALVLIGFLLVPFGVQLRAFLLTFPQYLEQITAALGIDFNQEEVVAFISSQIRTFVRNVFALTAEIIAFWVAAVATIIISIYLLYDHQRFQRAFVSLFPLRYRKRAFLVFRQAERRLGLWAIGQLLDSLVTGILILIGLLIIDLDFALPLALLAAIFELIPTIGLILAIIPALIVGLSVSLGKAVLVAVVYLLAEFIESNFIIPQIMRQSIRVHPIAIITAILIGAELRGIIGAFLAVPITALIVVLVDSLKRPESELDF